MPKESFKTSQLKIMSKNLKRLRDEKKLDQIELAEEAGVSVSVIRSIEQASKFPRPENIVCLAEALGVDPREITEDRVANETDIATQLFEKMKSLMQPQVVTVQMPTQSTSPHLKSIIEKLERLDITRDMVMLKQIEDALRSYLSLRETALTPKKKAK